MGSTISPRTSNVKGSLSFFGIDFICIIFSVTSSPICPSPRVTPFTSIPFSYKQLILSPSSFSSKTYSIFSAVFSSIFFILLSKSSISPILYVLDRLSIGTLCATFWNFWDATPPTFCVTVSSIFNSGYCISNNSIFFIKTSYS